MGEVKVWSHSVSLTFYRLTSRSFHVNQPSHSWDTTFSKFDLENPRSRSWKRWTLKVTTWVQHSIGSHPFRSMSIGHLIHKRRLFQNLTLKIEGQGHGWGESWKSPHGSNILSTHIPFIPSQSAVPFLRYDFLKKLTLKIQGQCHGWGQSWKSQSPIDSHPFRSMSISLPIHEKQHFQNLILKIQGQGHGWGGHWKSHHGSNILSTHIPLIPCQSAVPFLRYDFFKKFQRSRSWVRGTLKVTKWVKHPIVSHPFKSMSIGHPIPEIRLFQNLTLKIQGQGHGWGERWKSQSGRNIPSTRIPFVPCQSALPFMR